MKEKKMKNIMQEAGQIFGCSDIFCTLSHSIYTRIIHNSLYVACTLCAECFVMYLYTLSNQPTNNLQLTY